MKKIIPFLILLLISCAGHQAQGPSTIYKGSYMTARNIEAEVTLEVFSDGYIKGKIDSIGQGIEYDMHFNGPYSRQYHDVYYSEYGMHTPLKALVVKGNLDFYYFRFLRNNIAIIPSIELRKKE